MPKKKKYFQIQILFHCVNPLLLLSPGAMFKQFVSLLPLEKGFSRQLQKALGGVSVPGLPQTTTASKAVAALFSVPCCLCGLFGVHLVLNGLNCKTSPRHRIDLNGHLNI